MAILAQAISLKRRVVSTLSKVVWQVLLLQVSRGAMPRRGWSSVATLTGWFAFGTVDLSPEQFSSWCWQPSKPVHVQQFKSEEEPRRGGGSCTITGGASRECNRCSWRDRVQKNQGFQFFCCLFASRCSVSCMVRRGRNLAPDGWVSDPSRSTTQSGAFADGWTQFISRPTEASRSTTQSRARWSVAPTTESLPPAEPRRDSGGSEETRWRHRSRFGGVGRSRDHRQPRSAHSAAVIAKSEACCHRSPSQGATLSERGLSSKGAVASQSWTQREQQRFSNWRRRKREGRVWSRQLLPKKFQSTVRPPNQNWTLGSVQGAMVRTRFGRGIGKAPCEGSETSSWFMCRRRDAQFRTTVKGMVGEQAFRDAGTLSTSAHRFDFPRGKEDSGSVPSTFCSCEHGDVKIGAVSFRDGLHGQRVGEASHPGPPAGDVRRTQFDTDSDAPLIRRRGLPSGQAQT